MSGELHKAGVAALCYHAGLSDGERSAVQQRWVQEDHCKVGWHPLVDSDCELDQIKPDSETSRY